MKEEKGKNIIIGLLIAIIILLIVIIGLILTDKTKISSVNNNKVDNQTEETTILTESEAKEIIETRTEIANDFFESSNTYCGPDGSELANEINENNEKPFIYYSINNYNTFSELENYLLNFMTKNALSLNDYYNENNYLEQNNKLYCKIAAKGGTVVTYGDINIDNIKQNEIKATIDATRNNLGSVDSIKINITLTKINDIWKISSYERIENN